MSIPAPFPADTTGPVSTPKDPSDLIERLDTLRFRVERMLLNLEMRPAPTPRPHRAVQLAEAVLAGQPPEQTRPLARLLLHGQHLAETMCTAEIRNDTRQAG